MKWNQVCYYGADVPEAQTEEEAERCGLSDAALKDLDRTMVSAGDFF